MEFAYRSLSDHGVVACDALDASFIEEPSCVDQLCAATSLTAWRDVARIHKLGGAEYHNTCSYRHLGGYRSLATALPEEEAAVPPTFRSTKPGVDKSLPMPGITKKKLTLDKLKSLRRKSSKASSVDV
jgi:hypothetical protein